MPTTPTNFDYLDAPEHIGSEYDHIRKALKLYVKVIEALNNDTRSIDFDVLVNERFHRVLHYINTHFTPPASAAKKNVKWAEMLEEVRKMFYGVAADGNSARFKSKTAVERGYEFTQRMWTLPPELLETTIAVCMARDFLSSRRGRLRPSYEITVRGKKVNPWTTWAKNYFSLVLEA